MFTIPPPHQNITSTILPQHQDLTFTILPRQPDTISTFPLPLLASLLMFLLVTRLLSRSHPTRGPGSLKLCQFLHSPRQL